MVQSHVADARSHVTCSAAFPPIGTRQSGVGSQLFTKSTLQATGKFSAYRTAMSPKIDFNSIEGDLSDEQIQELLCNAERRREGEAVASHKQHAAHSQQK